MLEERESTDAGEQQDLRSSERFPAGDLITRLSDNSAY